MPEIRNPQVDTKTLINTCADILRKLLLLQNEPILVYCVTEEKVIIIISLYRAAAKLTSSSLCHIPLYRTNLVCLLLNNTKTAQRISIKHRVAYTLYL